MEPLARIRLHPEHGSRLHATAVVWPSAKAMREHLRATGHPNPRETAACCRELEVYHIRRGKPDRKDPIFAEVHLNLRTIGAGLVAHELYHATAAFARRLGLSGMRMFSPSDERGRACDEEERLAQAHGMMVSRFWTQAYDRGLCG